MNSSAPGRPVTLGSLPDEPLVSILITSYNYASYVGTAIDSALSQTYQRLEVIVCDDGSTDGSRAVIEQHCERDARARLIELASNRGMAAATNAAFAASTGEIICLLDADDVFAPSKVERVVRCFQDEPRTGIIVHPVSIIDEQGVHLQQLPFMTRFERGWIAERVIERGGRWRDMMTSAISFRRDLARFVFPIPEAPFKRAADGYIFTLLPLLTEVSSIGEPLTQYRVHGANDHGALGLSPRTVRAEMRFLEAQNEQVNLKIAGLSGCSDMLVLEKHLGYKQRRLIHGMLSHQPRYQLAIQTTQLMPSLLRDDLYSWRQKFLGVLVYWVALLLPDSARARWIGTTLGVSPVKFQIQRSGAFLRGRFGSPRARGRVNRPGRHQEDE